MYHPISLRIEPFRNFEAELGRIIYGRKVFDPGSGHKGNKIKFWKHAIFANWTIWSQKNLNFFSLGDRRLCHRSDLRVRISPDIEKKYTFSFLLIKNERNLFCTTLSFINFYFDLFPWIFCQNRLYPGKSGCISLYPLLSWNFMIDPMTSFCEKLWKDEWTNGHQTPETFYPTLCYTLLHLLWNPGSCLLRVEILKREISHSKIGQNF